MSFAFAISAAQPIEDYETPSDLARAILARSPADEPPSLHVAACTGRDGRGEPAIAVYRHGELVGYAIGLGHDRDALRLILDCAQAERAR